MSVAFQLAAPKFPDVSSDKTVRPREPASVTDCPSEPEKLRPLFRYKLTQINDAIEATRLQSLSQDSMEQHDGEQGGL